MHEKSLIFTINSLSVQIRRADRTEDYFAVERIQRDIWGMEGECPVPVPILVAMNNNGGLIEVAEEGGRIIGFSMAFPGKHKGREFLYSHMAGVLKEYRNMNIGYQIKMHQFESAKLMGYNEVRWTFDPLKARNSYFNTHKLKAFAFGYKLNYYGFMESKENRGVESDRIEAHRYMDREPQKIDVFIKVNLASGSVEQSVHEDSIGIGIPADIPQTDTALVNKWRHLTRGAILTLEENDFVMVDVLKDGDVDYLIFSKREKSGLLR